MTCARRSNRSRAPWLLTTTRGFWAALAALPEACRHAFLLNRFDGLSQREIALRMGISEKTVERHVLRALGACHDTAAKTGPR